MWILNQAQTTEKNQTKARRGMVDALKQNHFANVRKMVVIK